MELAKNILTIIQVIIWPTVLLFVFIAFRQPITNLLQGLLGMIESRGVNLTKSGVEIPSQEETNENLIDIMKGKGHYRNFLKQNQLEMVDEPLKVLVESSDLEKPHNIQHTREEVRQKKDLHEQDLVRSIESALQNLLKDTSNDKLKYELIECLLYDAYICLFFERSFTRLVPSQLSFLKRIRGKIPPRMSTEETQIFLKENNNLGFSFERWIAFLLSSGFIFKKDGSYFLSQQGRALLTYLDGRQYPSYTQID